LVGGRTFACEPNIRAATLIIKHVVAVPFPSSGFFAGSDAVWIFASDWSCRNEQIRLRDARQTNPELLQIYFGNNFATQFRQKLKKKSARSSENTGIENATHNTFPKKSWIFFGNVLWVAFSNPSGSLSLMK
jgi:hypothetical protein